MFRSGPLANYGQQVASGGGGGGTDPWITLDGRLNAKPGTPQFPAILNTYHPAGPSDGRYSWPSLLSLNGSTGNLQQPPWQQAGVDYPVGLYSNCTVNTSTSFISNTGTQSNYSNGQQVTLRTANGGTLPTGVALNTAYVVLNASGATFQIAQIATPTVPITLGGSPNLVTVLMVIVPSTNCLPPGVVWQGTDGTFNDTIIASGAADASNGGRAVSSPGTITIDSYDLSFSGGMSLSLNIGNGYTVNCNNCYWRVGSNLQSAVYQDAAFPSITFNTTYCEMDGGGLSFANSNFGGGLGHLLYLPPGGTHSYLWIHHTLHPIVASFYTPYTIKFCLFNNMNYGIQASHNDCFFPAGGSNLSGTSQIFSTWYQPAGAVGAGGNGYPGEMDTSFVVFLQLGASSVITTAAAANTTNVIHCINGDISQQVINNPTLFAAYDLQNDNFLGNVLSATGNTITLTTNNVNALVLSDSVTCCLIAAITNLSFTNNAIIGIGQTGHMNTLSQTGGAAMNVPFFLEPRIGTTINGIAISQNYVDSTGIDPNGFIILDNELHNGPILSKNYSGNVSMNSGATIHANGPAGTQ